MDRFYELSEDTIEDFFAIFNKKSFPVSIKFQFIGDTKQKSLIKIAKIGIGILYDELTMIKMMGLIYAF
jgi:hypothetical protein